jgi:hypothetical protein
MRVAVDSPLARRLGALAALVVTLLLLAAPTAARADFNMFGFNVNHETAPRVDQFGNVSGDQPDLLTAAAHPYLNVGFTLTDNNLQATNLEDIQEFVVHFPPGELGNAAAVPRCPVFLFNLNACPATTKVGTLSNRALQGGSSVTVFGSIYNLEPAGSEPARLASYVPAALAIAPIVIEVRDDGDFGVDSTTKDIPRTIGIPPGQQDITVRNINFSMFNQVGSPAKPFWTNPTSCIPATTSIEAVSYSGSHASAPAATFTPTGCGSPATRPPFDPAIDATLDTSKADASSGYTIGIDFPVNEDASLQDQAHLKRAEVTLPAGVTLNAGAADQLESCTEAQFGVGSTAPARCPASSQVGDVTVETPALLAPLHGHAYFAEPTDADPWRLLMEIEGSGMRLKLINEVTLDPQTGQIKTVVDDLPQQPFSRFELRLNGGAKAVLQNPSGCGTHAITTSLTPWSAAPSFAAADDSHPQATFATSADGAGAPCESPQPFRPTLSTTSDPSQAGANTHSKIEIGRPAGHQLLKRLSLQLPAGLIGSLNALPLCPTDRVVAGTCDESSKIGALKVSVGGTDAPLQAPGSIYLGRPLQADDIASLSIVVSAKAGPIDLGKVVVANRVRLRPSDQGVDVISGDLPAILESVPLRVGKIEVEINREGFMTNPTGCDVRALKGSFDSDQGASGNAEANLQATGCEALRFAPDLRLIAEGERERFGHPALRAIVSQSGGQASIKRAVVGLPDVLRPELPTIQKSLCTSAQLAANACPAASIVGNATANTPLLPSPLSGPVFLVQDPNPVDPLPRIVVRLAGMASVELSARNTIEGVRTVNTFENVPDVPISRFEIYVNGGKSGILKNFHDLCSTTSRAEATFSGHNGASSTSRPPLEVGGCGPGSSGGVTISKKAVKLKGDRVARVRLSCSSPDGCEGKLTLAQAAKLRSGRKAKSKSKGAPLGSSAFSIAPNRTATVEVKLSRKGLRAVSKRGRLAVTATAVTAGSTATARLNLSYRIGR